MENHEAPYTEASSSTNGLKSFLNGEKKVTVDGGATKTGNPLKDFLKEDKRTQERTEPLEPEVNGDKPEAPAGAQEPNKDEPPQFSKKFDYTKSTERLVKGFDQVASRLLKILAKDENRKRWQISDEDVAEIMEWAEPTAERYQFTVENPLWGLLGTLSIIYGEKTWQAYEMRQQKDKIERLQRENEYLRTGKRAPAAAGPVVDDEPTDEDVAEFKARVNQIRRERNQQRTVAEPVEVVYEVNDEVIKPQPKTNVERPKKDFSKAFDFKKQMDREFFNDETDISTANEDNISTVSQGERSRTPPVETGFIIAVDGVTAAKPNGKPEPFETIKGDKRNRPTEVIRCPISGKLFERFVGQDKIFINNAAKNDYHYFLKCQREGKVPKKGFPKWWNSG